jgi:DNA-directed RNA polymerase I, II, and III subunit RPABC2
MPYQNISTTANSQMLSKYEKSRVIGIRALQISQGAKLYVDPQGETNPLRIAQMELRKQKMPLKIKRTMPDGSYELVSVNTLICD